MERRRHRGGRLLDSRRRSLAFVHPLSFNDGIPRLFLWGVLASPVAAAAAVLLPPRHGLLIHGLMLLCYAVDRRVHPAHGLQAWQALRWRFSLVAATSCFAAAVIG